MVIYIFNTRTLGRYLYGRLNVRCFPTNNIIPVDFIRVDDIFCQKHCW